MSHEKATCLALSRWLFREAVKVVLRRESNVYRSPAQSAGQVQGTASQLLDFIGATERGTRHIELQLRLVAVSKAPGTGLRLRVRGIALNGASIVYYSFIRVKLERVIIVASAYDCAEWKCTYSGTDCPARQLPLGGSQ